jgi:hypothetical protein
MSDEQTTAAEQDDEQGGGRKPSAATLLVELARAYFEVFAAEDGAPYAVALDGPTIALPLRGRDGLRQRLARLFFAEYGKAASAAALADALAVLEGEAVEAVRRPVSLRLARDSDGRIVLDLGSADGRCVIVAPGRWHVAERAPDGVLFRRSALTGALPEPARGGRVESLFSLLNCDTDAARLIVGWLVAALVPEIDHPILMVSGEQGSAKTTALRTLVNLVDPSPAPTRTAPRDVGAWGAAASASWVCGLDNVSTIPEWFSDALCRAVTGDGLVSRALYTDGDVAVLSFRRVLAMTSIDAGSLRGDLAERLLPVELERIDPTERRSATEVGERAAQVAPEVLAGLLDRLADVLVELPRVRTRELPRLADFARVLHALDAVTGWDTVADYADTASDIAAAVVEADPLAVRVLWLLNRDGKFEGTADELLRMLTPEFPPRDWPKAPQSLSARLKRSAPALREQGITVEFTRGTGKDRTRKVTIGRASGADPAATSDDPGSVGRSSDDVGGGSSDGSSDALTAAELRERSASDGADGLDGLSRLPSHVVEFPAVGVTEGDRPRAAGKLTGWGRPGAGAVPAVLADILGARPIEGDPADDAAGGEPEWFAALLPGEAS